MGKSSKRLLVTGLDVMVDWLGQYVKSAEIVCTSDVSEENLIRMTKDVDGILYMQIRSYPITRAIIEAGSRLKFIQSAGVGYELVDLDAATENLVVVMNAPTANTVSVAEHTVALILASAKNILKGHKSTVDGNWRTMDMGVELWKKNLGIIGFGRIGKEVAKRMKGFEMELLVCDPYLKKEEIAKAGGRKVDLQTLLKESDVVAIHSPLTNETRHMIGEKQLSLMKDSAILVNAARGEIIDEEALFKVLSEGRIRGAALDVFEKEPVEKGNPLLPLDNVVLTPHTAAQTPEALTRMMKLNGEQVEKALNGIYENVVNPKVLQ
ncbi:MAG: hydroxyacid dehydrogenase [Promethearchaeati archaeon SRVP18_Atabeyarchaeia-1]